MTHPTPPAAALDATAPLRAIMQTFRAETPQRIKWPRHVPPTLTLAGLAAAAVLFSPLLLVGAIVLGATGVPTDLNGEPHECQASL